MWRALLGHEALFANVKWREMTVIIIDQKTTIILFFKKQLMILMATFRLLTCKLSYYLKTVFVVVIKEFMTQTYHLKFSFWFECHLSVFEKKRQ